MLSPINNGEGGYRNSLRPSVSPSFHQSIWKESPLTFTIFHRSLPNFYSIFIPLYKLYFLKFHKNVAKIVAMATIFLVKPQYMSTSVSSLHESMKASGCHMFTIPSQRCSTTYVQFSKHSDQNSCHDNNFTVQFSSYALFNNHNLYMHEGDTRVENIIKLSFPVESIMFYKISLKLFSS